MTNVTSRDFMHCVPTDSTLNQELKFLDFTCQLLIGLSGANLGEDDGRNC